MNGLKKINDSSVRPGADFLMHTGCDLAAIEHVGPIAAHCIFSSADAEVHQGSRINLSARC